MLRWGGLSFGANLSVSLARPSWAELTPPGPQASAERLPFPPSPAPGQEPLPSCAGPCLLPRGSWGARPSPGLSPTTPSSVTLQDDRSLCHPAFSSGCQSRGVSRAKLPSCSWVVLPQGEFGDSLALSPQTIGDIP